MRCLFLRMKSSIGGASFLIGVFVRLYLKQEVRENKVFSWKYSRPVFSKQFFSFNSNCSFEGFYRCFVVFKFYRICSPIFVFFMFLNGLEQSLKQFL